MARGEQINSEVITELTNKQTEAETKFGQTVSEYEREKEDIKTRKEAATAANDTVALSAIKQEEKNLSKKEAAYNTAKDSLTKAQINLDMAIEMGNKNLREVENEANKLRNKAENSQEKKDLTKAEEDAKKPAEEFKEAQRQYNENKKIIDALKKKRSRTPAEESRLQDAENLEINLSVALDNTKESNDKAKSKLNEAKRKYNELYENKIKALENAVKESVKKAEKVHKDDIDALQDNIAVAGDKVIDKEFEIKEKTTQRKLAYADSLIRNRNNEDGTAAGGAAFGGQVRNENTTAATNIRNSITGNNRPPTPGGNNR